MPDISLLQWNAEAFEKHAVGALLDAEQATDVRLALKHLKNALDAFHHSEKCHELIAAQIKEMQK